MATQTVSKKISLNQTEINEAIRNYLNKEGIVSFSEIEDIQTINYKETYGQVSCDITIQSTPSN